MTSCRSTRFRIIYFSQRLLSLPEMPVELALSARDEHHLPASLVLNPFSDRLFLLASSSSAFALLAVRSLACADDGYGGS
jgi:hypothetical protein